MFNVQLVARLWDIEDEGIDAVLDRLQGDWGVGGLTVVAASGPVCSLRRRPGIEPRIFRSRGGVYFQPDVSKYENTRIKPIVSGWLKSRNPLANIADACRRRNISLRAAVDTRGLGRFAARHPDAAVKSPFGDVSQTLMCPMNPDVAEFLRSLASDLAEQHDLTALELRDLDDPFRPDDALSDQMRDLGAGHRALLCVCCCESCLQAAATAGIDTASAVRSMQIRLGRAIDAGRFVDSTLNELVGDDPQVRAYLADRRSAHAQLIGTLRKRTTCRLAMHVPAASRTFATTAWIDSIDYLVLYPVVHSANHSDGADEFQFPTRVRSPIRCEACVPVGRPTTIDCAELVRLMKSLADSGWSGAQLDHYGAMTNDDLIAVRQAVRFAKRSAKS